MSARRFIERFLILAVAILVILTVVRLATGGSVPPPAPGRPAMPPPAATALASDAPPPSPAAAELLARIRSCSEQDLEGIVGRITPVEAAGLYGKLSATDRQTVLSALPAPVLARKANALLGIPEGRFRSAARPGLLAASLVDAAMGAAGPPAGLPPLALSFATAVDANNAPQGPRTSFRPDERRIYACLDAGPDGDIEAGVLVRWTEQASGTLVLLQYKPFAINRRWNYVYFEAESWAPGTYRVAFHRLGETATLLAEGTYVIGRGN